MREGLFYGAGAVGVGLYVLGQQSVSDVGDAAPVNYTADEAAELFDAAMQGDIQTSAMMGIVEKVGGTGAGVPEAAMFIAACGVIVKVIEKLTPHFNATGSWLDRALNSGGRTAAQDGDEAKE